MYCYSNCYFYFVVVCFVFLRLTYMYDCFACMYVCTMCVPCTPGGQKRALEHLELELQIICEHWKLNLGPLQEHQVFLTTKRFLNLSSSPPITVHSSLLEAVTSDT